MAYRIDQLTERLRDLHEQMETEFARQRETARYRIENGRITFEAEVKRRHREIRLRFWAFVRRTRPMTVVTAPVIYSLIVPFALLHLMVWLYQTICFPVYGIAKVRQRDYIRIDRHHLAYLNGVQKVNCVYCGYCNGVVAWVREVASRTEAFWCPIKHASRVEGTHPRYAGFMEFGDGERFQSGYALARANIVNNTRREEAHRKEAEAAQAVEQRRADRDRAERDG